MRERLNSRGLAALISSQISQLILLLSLLFPLNPLNSNSNFNSHSNSFRSILFLLIHHLLSASEIYSALSLFSFSRKRKRTHFREPKSPDDDDDSRFAQRDWVDSVVPRSPDSCKNLFRMNSSTFEWLCGLLEPLLDCRDPVDSPLNLTAESRLGIGLFRLATGADYSEISSWFKVSEPIVKFCVKQLCRVLCTNYRFWISFPSQNELDSVSTPFETLTGLPNCCGILHCVRFKVRTNSGHASISQDRPPELSIAAQLVVDSSSRILHVAAGFRGNKDDYTVLKGSTLYQDVEKGTLLNSGTTEINNVAVPQYLVADGDYPLLPWLLVPIDDPIPGSVEENFNVACAVMRVRMRRAVASLRNWKILSRPIEAELKAAVAYVGACSILHNMLLTREDYSAFCDELEDSSSADRISQRFRDNVDMEDMDVEKAAALDARRALATKARSSL